MVVVSSWHSSSYLSPGPRPPGRHCAHDAGAACTRQKQKGPCPPSIGDLCSGCCLLLLIKERAATVAPSHIVASPSPSSRSDLQEMGMPGALPHAPWFFTFPPLGSQKLKMKTFKNNFIWKKNYSVTTHPQGRAQKRPKNTLNLYLRLFLCTETACNNSNKNPNSKQKQK